MATPATHFLTLLDHDSAWLGRVLDRAADLRDELRREGANRPILARMSLAMVFEKASLRTRVSFEAAMTQLGGHAINLQPAEIGLGTREPAGDAARVLGGMCEGIMARVYDHVTLEQLALASPVPVINGLSDRFHPCQSLADILTLRDAFGRDLDGRRMAYVGDANNVMRSLAVACERVGVSFIACCPQGYGPGEGDGVEVEHDPRRAVEGADAVYTDTWTSMGREAERAARIEAFAGYTVTGELLALAKPQAVVLHCLPAYRGLEIAADVLEGPQSRVWEQAHNRLHAQKGLLAMLLGAA